MVAHLWYFYCYPTHLFNQNYYHFLPFQCEDQFGHAFSSIRLLLLKTWFVAGKWLKLRILSAIIFVIIFFFTSVFEISNHHCHDHGLFICSYFFSLDNRCFLDVFFWQIFWKCFYKCFHWKYTYISRESVHVAGCRKLISLLYFLGNCSRASLKMKFIYHGVCL